MWYLLSVVAALILGICQGDVKVSLSQGKWTVTNHNRSIKVAARVPGSIYTDLQHGGLLGMHELYYRFKDIETRWVSYENWTYSTLFTVTSFIMQQQTVELVAEGLDTVAMVTLNGHLLGKTDNMFRRYVWSVKSQLRVGVNSLEVSFTSPVWYGSHESAGYPYIVPPECPPPVQHGECHVNFVRKEACSYSWDWGPAFPTMGIWKDLYLQGYDQAIIRDVKVTTVKEYHGWLLNVSVCAGVAKLGCDGITVYVAIPGIFNQSLTLDTSTKFTCTPTSIKVSENVDLWWPYGYGEQKLYDLIVSFPDQDEENQKILKIGFRTVELVQESVSSSQGLSFYFKVNHFPVFMKGSNWIPADAFQERITDHYLQRLLTSAIQANINMLRVWGGGVYESDMFYSLADEYGILIWQDFMFACSMYPTHDAFLQNVWEEITYQVRRLSHHPSIAIWAGNNENEAALASNSYNTTANYSLYYRDYIDLYIDTVGKAVMHSDTSRPFVPSSPSNGRDTQTEGWVAKNPYSEFYGDVHYYNYDSNTWDWPGFPTPRFASEYGIQAWPSFHSLQNVSEPEDWKFNSSWVNHRQHHQDGNKQMLNEIALNLKVPELQDATVWFRSYIYLSQINQAMGIKTESEHYRRSQWSVRGGRGETMGALYWQLNDIWQAPTWASIEYGGKWKMLHYYVVSFFAPVLLSPYLNGTQLLVTYIEDPTPTKNNLKWKDKAGNQQENEVVRMRWNEEAIVSESPVLVIQCYSWASMDILKQWNVPFIKPSAGGGEVFYSDVNKMLHEAKCPSKDHCIFYFSLQHQPSIKNWLLLGKPKDAVGMRQVTVIIENVSYKGENLFSVELSTDGIAAFVWLEAQGIQGRFSDNGFMMFVKTTTINFLAWEPVRDENVLKKALSVISLADIYTAV